MLTLEVPLEFIASHIMIIGFEIFLAYIYHSQCSSSIICIFHMVTNIHTYISERALKRSLGGGLKNISQEFVNGCGSSTGPNWHLSEPK